MKLFEKKELKPIMEQVIMSKKFENISLSGKTRSTSPALVEASKSLSRSAERISKT